MIIIWILILKFKLNKIYFIYIYCFLKFEIDPIINEEINKSDIFFSWSLIRNMDLISIYRINEFHLTTE